MVEEWRRAAWSASMFMLVWAFWSQPFAEIPSTLWMEIKLLPAAGYLWWLGRMWNKEEGKQREASGKKEGNGREMAVAVDVWQTLG